MKRTLALAVFVAAAVAAVATAATSTLTLTANPTTVTYGKTTVLTGQLTPAQANQNIAIQAAICPTNTTFKRSTAVKTASTGAFTATVTPTAMTTYKATLHQTESPAVVVKVKPVVALKRVARGSYSVSVTAAASLVGKSLTIQRYSTLRHRWLRVKKVALTTMTNGTKPTVITSATFKSKLKRRTRVRALLPLAQAQPCYVGATSNTVRA
jgi:hypothetical protein